jgi:hypothetical protein
MTSGFRSRCQRGARRPCWWWAGDAYVYGQLAVSFALHACVYSYAATTASRWIAHSFFPPVVSSPATVVGCLHSTPAIAIASDRGGAPVWVPPFYTVEILFSPVATLFNTITILFYIGCHPCTPVYPPPLASEMVMRADWAAGPACACMSVPRQARGRTAPDSCATVGSASCHQPTDKRDSSVTRSSAPRG